MFIDDYGNEFKTETEAREYAKGNFLELFNKEPIYYLEEYVTNTELLNWIFAHEEAKTLFLKDYADVIERIKLNIVEDYIWNLEEFAD